MRRLPAALGLAVLLVAGTAASADKDDAATQAELDRRCEAARDKALAPIREDIYKECLQKKRGDEGFCRRDADGYNGDRIGGAPRFYELPECQKAFEFRNRKRAPR
jgi:hypothetical protein